LRKALGHEYNKTCRVTSNDHGRKNRKLKKQISELKAKVAELELAMKKEEAIAS
jgi:hypothetical protein